MCETTREFLSTFQTQVRLFSVRICQPRRLKAEKDRVVLLNACKRIQFAIEKTQFKWKTTIAERKQMECEYTTLLNQVQQVAKQRVEDERELARSQGREFKYKEKDVMEWLDYEETRMMSALKMIKSRIKSMVIKCLSIKSLADLFEEYLLRMDKMLMAHENSMMFCDVTSSLESIKGVDIISIGENMTASIENSLHKAEELSELLAEVKRKVDETDNHFTNDLGKVSTQAVVDNELNKEIMSEVFAFATPAPKTTRPEPPAPQPQQQRQQQQHHHHRIAIPTALPADEEDEEEDVESNMYYPPQQQYSRYSQQVRHPPPRAYAT